MSWKLTKKLKETHLGPLANSFGRSSSTSTIKGEPAEETTPVPSQRPSITSQVSNGIADSEALVSPPVALVKPGILIVTLHEGKGFSLSPHYQQIISSHFQNPNAPIRPNSSSSHSAQAAGSYTQPARPQSTSSGINAAPTIHGRYLTKYLPYALLDFDKNQVFVDAVSGTPENPLWAGDNTAFKFDVSRQTELSIQIYLRNPAARPGAGRSEDIFLGATKMQPRLQETATYVENPKLSKKDNQKAAAEQEKNVGQLENEWLDLQFGTGSIKIGLSFVENRAHSMKLEDFELLKGEFFRLNRNIDRDADYVMK
ncbi:hypothetical protein EIK77_006241 [Talaromyces pinophilus]|nr:hypothetical protein EIK77_006241 [Talaromyces pinophilus]